MSSTTHAQSPPALVGLRPAETWEMIRTVPGGERAFRGAQIHRWIHARAVTEFESMTDLPAGFRAALAERFRISELAQVSVARAKHDDTVKLVLRTTDGAEVETVRITTPKRVTLCVSSQVGCGFGCTFCRTARMGLVRNLNAGEIVDQILHVERLSPLPERYNVVFMGMGEPLANYEQVMRATEVFGAGDGLGIGPRRITISTVGLVPEIRRLAIEHPKLRLALSLTGTTDAIRSQLMPIGRRYPLATLLPAVGFHVETTGKRVTLEYVLLKGVNDSMADARRLATIANRFPSKVNIIPFNGDESDNYQRPAGETIQRFVEYLYPRTYAVTVRATQGRDILAACGQLARLPEGREGTRDDRVSQPTAPAT